MGKKVLLIGGGGHCHSVLDSILALGDYDQIGIIDLLPCSFKEAAYLGTDDDISALAADGWTDAVITLGSVGDTSRRRALFQKAAEAGLRFPTIVDPTAAVSPNALLGSGVFVGKGAVVNFGSVVGDFAIVNTGAIIEHDCTIGAFSHVSPGTVLCGHVHVGEDAHIGAGSVAIQEISIGKGTLVGAGSVIIHDLPDKVKAYGNPCRVVE